VKKLLLHIDDDAELQSWVKEALPKELFLVESAATAREGFDLAIQRKPDLCLLDWNLAGINGLDLCKAFQQHKATAYLPIIMLTGYSESKRKIAAFERGVDDYIVKPFDMEELIARIKAVLRRRGAAPDDVLTVQGIELNATAHTVCVDRRPLVLTRMEYNLLYILMRNPGRVLSRAFLLERVWGYASHISTRTVDVYMVRLRQKLGPKRAACIESLRNVGYRFKSVKDQQPAWDAIPMLA
jgi:DNA-binding response OmpR family regulator